MATAIRLFARVNWFEILAVIVLVVLSAAGAAYVVVRFAGLGLAIDCLRDVPLADAKPCNANSILEFNSIANGLAGPALATSAFLPVVVGSLLGAPLVAREIETRTATLAWSLARSRRSWLGQRVLIIGLLAASLTLVPAIASTILVAATWPTLDPMFSFKEYGLHGPPLVIRAIAVTAVGVLLGSVIGRTLPAVVMTIAAGVLVVGLTFAAFPLWMPHQPLPADTSGNVDPGAALIGGWSRRSDGVLLSPDEVRAASPVDPEGPEFGRWYEANFTVVPGGYPGQWLVQVWLREGAALLLVAGVAVVGASVVVERRRPY